MAGLVPAISLREALCHPKRGHRDKPGDDKMERLATLARGTIAYFTFTCIDPNPVIDASMVSPGLIGPTPSGVPVSSTSPGCSV